jgi:nitroreductase/NAD-dependent dihydropyrimidine dehydrogenase PreA subunit
MVTVIGERCNRCGLCVDICHESCIGLAEGGPQIDDSICSGCTQCIAVCPSQALGWQGRAPERFNRQNLPTAVQLSELFKERRSIRRFKDIAVDPEILEEIASVGIYAPSHASTLRAIIVDDPALIDLMDQTLLNMVRWIHRIIYRMKLIAGLATLLGFGGELSRDRVKIEASLDTGHSFHCMPKAIIFVVGKKNGVLSNESAQYSLANMMYFAQVKGVGACLWANGPIFMDRVPTIRRKLGISREERIYGSLYMGYPAIRYSNTVAGKQIPIQWNGCRSD